jgi:prepilin-type N-terminal cleavage/methylation domain-containing protein
VLRREHGFTLPEMLIAMVIALIVSLATFSLIEVAMKRSGDIALRVEASQKGRLAMDTMTREMRSQVCLSKNDPPMYAATPDSATFYAEFTDQSLSTRPPERRTITFNPVAGTLVESTFVSASTAAPYVYPATPTRTKTLVTNVTRYGTTPIFQYFAFGAATPPRPDLTLPATSGMATADLARVALIKINFRVRAKAGTDSGSIVLVDDVYVRAADPDAPAPTPNCT